jgi:hypothetical protein
MKNNLKDFLTIDKISILQVNGIYLQEIVALYYDLRPLLRTGIAPWKYELFKKTISELGFKLLIMKTLCGPNRSNPLCLISKFTNILKKYSELEKKYYVGKSITTSLIGNYLGYPSCCIEKFAKNCYYYYYGKNKNYPTKTLSNSKGRLDFRLNYLYNFDSRNFDNQEYKQISESYRLSGFYLIPHRPCSFNCKESIRYAQKILDILKLEFPEYYKELISILKKPILYFSDFVFFPLIGKMKGDTLSYQDFLKIHDRLPIETVKLLNKGNLIKRKNDRFQIYKDDQCIMDKLPSSVKLFNFE